MGYRLGSSECTRLPWRSIQLKRRRLVRHPLAHADMAQSFPKLIDFGQHCVVRLIDIDRMRDRHPARSAGHPKYFRAIAFGIEVVTAERADVIHQRVDAQTCGDQATMERAKIIKRRDPK